MLKAPPCPARDVIQVSGGPERALWIVTSGLEHHAMMGPMARLPYRAMVHVVPPGAGRAVDLTKLEALLQRGRHLGHPMLVAMTMASNVTGSVLPLAQVASLARAHGALLLLDGAQVAGVAPLSLDTLKPDAFAFAGHKGPQGPHGIGGLWLGAATATLTDGPDGQQGPDGHTPPSFVTAPDYCDAGSVNLVGAVGLAAGLETSEPRMSAHQHTQYLRRQLADGLSHIPQARIIDTGHPDDGYVLPLSVVIDKRRPQELERQLGNHGVVVRGGTHCAPAAHHTLGTSKDGTLRFSAGVSNTANDVDRAIETLKKVLR